MPTDILAIEDCVQHLNTNFDKLYPKDKGRRKTLGNIPDALHKDIMERADRHRVHAAVYVASLMDFLDEYELENKTQLAQQRPTPVKKRK